MELVLVGIFCVVPFDPKLTLCVGIVCMIGCAVYTRRQIVPEGYARVDFQDSTPPTNEAHRGVQFVRCLPCLYESISVPLAVLCVAESHEYLFCFEMIHF